MTSYNNYKKVAIQAAQKAGQYLLKEFKKPNSSFNHKGKTELVTQADKKAEEIILRLIKKKFPKHRILSEESGWINQSSNSPYLWLIDPMDGTTNFILRSPLFAISIALTYKQEIILGTIYAPVTNELYIAEKGRGAYLNQRKIKVSSRKNLNHCFLTSGYSAKKKDERMILKFYPKIISKSEHHRDLGSAALELAFVAAGRFDGGINLGHRPFDVAAGVLMVREAGGLVTNFQNQPWTIKDKYLIASNGWIHQKLLQIVRFI